MNPSDIKEAASHTIFVKNPGNVALQVHSMLAVGDHPQDFQINGTTSTTIAPGASAAIGITFKPADKGSRRAAIRVNSSDPAKPNVDVALTGTGLSTAESWRNLHFQQTEATGDAADSADPDHDGLNNLVERAFNLHPREGGRPQLATGSGASGLPATSLSGSQNSRRLNIAFLRRKGPPDPGLTYQALFADSPDPDAVWSPSSIQESVTAIDDFWERVTIEDSQTGAPRRFARIKLVPTE